MKCCGLHYRNLHCHLVGYKGHGTRQPKTVPKLNNTNAIPVQQVTSNAAQITLPTSPTSSSTRNPENDERSHPLSTSTSGPPTPDGVLTMVKAEVENGGKQQKSSEQATVPAPAEAGSMTIPSENGALLAEVLAQNTTLRER